MPIATPEVYAEMLDRAKAGSFAYPAINVSSSQTLNAALRGFADAGSDGIVQVSTGGAEYLSGPTIKDMVAGCRRRWPSTPTSWPRKYPVNIALHTDHCPKDKLDALRAAAARDQPGAGRRGRRAAVPVAHVGRLGRRASGEPRHRPRAARRVRQGEDRAGGRDRRRRRRGGRRRRRDQREALLHDRGRAATAEALGTGREGPLHARRHVRQRARRLQARQREAASASPQGHPGRRSAASTARPSRSTSSSTAASARCSRRSARRWTTAW